MSEAEGVVDERNQCGFHVDLGADTKETQTQTTNEWL
jgi:hypothetical protein